jgi:hypothetical protein
VFNKESRRLPTKRGFAEGLAGLKTPSRFGPAFQNQKSDEELSAAAQTA